MTIHQTLTFVLLTCCLSANVIAQRHSPADSLQILKYTKQLNRDLVIDPVEGEHDLSDEAIDSVLRNYNMGRYGGGKVHYAPDLSFKVFLIEGGGGAPYGNPMYASYIHFKSGKSLALENSFTPIVEIHKIGKDTFILIQHDSYRASSAFSASSYTVTQLSVKNDTAIYVPILYGDNPPIYNNDREGEFTVYTYHPYEGLEKTFIIFDPKSKKLTYSFIIDYVQVSSSHNGLLDKFKNENQIIEVKGSFIVKDGVLQFRSETYKVMDFKYEEE